MFENAPYIDKMPNAKIKKEDIIYVHRADPNKKLEFAEDGYVLCKYHKHKKKVEE